MASVSRPSGRSRPSQLGATLVELIVTIVILSIAMVSLAMTLSFSASHSADAMVQAKTVELGQAYLEEILTKGFDENTPVGGIPACSAATIACGSIGPEAGETRATFDDVDDYHGLNDSPPRDSLGVVRNNYDGYSVAVSVVYMTASQLADYGLGSTTDAKLITASVTPPGGTAVVFSVYRANF